MTDCISQRRPRRSLPPHTAFLKVAMSLLHRQVGPGALPPSLKSRQACDLSHRYGGSGRLSKASSEKVVRLPLSFLGLLALEETSYEVRSQPPRNGHGWRAHRQSASTPAKRAPHLGRPAPSCLQMTAFPAHHDLGQVRAGPLSPFPIPVPQKSEQNKIVTLSCSTWGSLLCSSNNPNQKERRGK